MSTLLQGVRVIEAAMLLNGDTLGGYLAELGCDVVKVEAPSRGDYLRDMLGQIGPHQSPAHLQVNRNKRSLALDLTTEAGRAVFFRLLSTADVFVDGLRAGVCNRLGIGYETQRAVKPEIVFCHVSGFGATGPYARIPTHGQMMNALAGGTPVAVSEDGLVRRVEATELMGGTSYGGDGPAVGALHACRYVLAALYRRGRTGEGAYLDVSAADAVVATGWIGAVYGWNEERLTDRSDLRSTGQTPHSGARYQWYQTMDERFVLFCAIEPKFFERFCEAVGRRDLLSRELGTRATPAGGGSPVNFALGDEGLRRALQGVFSTRTQREWIDLAVAEELPIGPSYSSVRDLLDDPHLRSRTIVVPGNRPDGGPFTYVGEPVVVDVRAPPAPPDPAPGLGEHTSEILAELGYDDEEVAQLRDAGIV